MKFPVINHIDDVLSHISDSTNFPVNRKEGYRVIDYILNSPEFFNNEFERECRGLIFNDDGFVIRRPMQKFFNYGEREETRNIDLNKSHVISEKLDGSMISSFIINDRLIWGSRAGETFLTPLVENFVKENPQYEEFSKEWIKRGWTPCFEFCSNKNRIVLSHPEDRLVLLSIRNMSTGEYYLYEDMKQLAKENNIEVVKTLDKPIVNMEDFASWVEKQEGIEGFVIRFDDGEMIKLKASQYVLHHKAKDCIVFEKNILAIVASGEADDFKVLLSDLDREKFERFEQEFTRGVERAVANLYELHYLYNQKTISRKDFALGKGKELSDLQRSFVFQFFDVEPFYNDFKKAVLDKIKNSCRSQTNVDNIRELFNTTWVY